jgi:hypothetical protein
VTYDPATMNEQQILEIIKKEGFQPEAQPASDGASEDGAPEHGAAGDNSAPGGSDTFPKGN